MLASYRGDEDIVRQFYESGDPELRATALSALVNMKKATKDDAERAVADASPVVRRKACELAPLLPGANYRVLLSSPEEMVVEAACFAIGETRDHGAVPDLMTVASAHKEALCRESAVAALGAIGDKKAIPQLIKRLDDSAAIRRRAVLALSVFIDDEAAVTAIGSMLDDKDWQVRQIAESILLR